MASSNLPSVIEQTSPLKGAIMKNGSGKRRLGCKYHKAQTQDDLHGFNKKMLRPAYPIEMYAICFVSSVGRAIDF